MAIKQCYVAIARMYGFEKEGMKVGLISLTSDQLGETCASCPTILRLCGTRGPGPQDQRKG